MNIVCNYVASECKFYIRNHIEGLGNRIFAKFGISGCTSKKYVSFSVQLSKPKSILWVIGQTAGHEHEKQNYDVWMEILDAQSTCVYICALSNAYCNRCAWKTTINDNSLHNFIENMFVSLN